MIWYGVVQCTYGLVRYGMVRMDIENPVVRLGSGMSVLSQPCHQEPPEEGPRALVADGGCLKIRGPFLRGLLKQDPVIYIGCKLGALGFL